MFNVDPNPTFAAPVHLSRPGLAQPIAVQVTFRHKNRVEVAAWVARGGGPQADDVQLLGEVIESWSGLIDAEGKEVPYSTTALSKLLTNYTPARGELFRAYLSELTDAKRKN